MTDPVSTGPRRETSFDVFPDALSALPLPALTLGVPPGVESAGGAPALTGSTGVAGGPPRPTAGRAPNPGAGRPPPATGTTAAGYRPPSGQPWSGFPPPGQPPPTQPRPIAPAQPYNRPAASPRPGMARPGRPVPTPSTGGLVAPGSVRRPVAGLGYSPPPTTTSGVVRPPAYLPQNQGLAQLRAAVQQARGTRQPASPPSAQRPAPPLTGRPPAAGRRRGNRASSAWSLIVFVIILLVSTGLGQKIIDAISQLLHHR